jgi:hypothetical protein
LKTGKDKRHFLAEVHIKFFRQPHELQAKDILGKITNSLYQYILSTIVQEENSYFTVKVSHLVSFHEKRRNINLELYGRHFQCYTGLQSFSEASLVLQRLLRLQCSAVY